MRSQRSCTSFVLVSLLTVSASVAAEANAAMSLPSASALVESTQTHIVEIKHQRRQPRRLVRRIYPRIAPSYIAYDYPYYYARGFYPTHIGPGYFYDGYPYLHGRRFYSRHRAR